MIKAFKNTDKKARKGKALIKSKFNVQVWVLDELKPKDEQKC